ncbi:unnamed protein product, partial [Meganyctiphanes norvegica]
MDCDGHTSDSDIQTNFLQGRYVKDLTNETKKIAKGQTDEEIMERISSNNVHDDDVMGCDGHMSDSDIQTNFLQGNYVKDLANETKMIAKGQTDEERNSSNNLHDDD